jgi:hypothetical protein
MADRNLRFPLGAPTGDIADGLDHVTAARLARLYQGTPQADDAQRAQLTRAVLDAVALGVVPHDHDSDGVRPLPVPDETTHEVARPAAVRRGASARPRWWWGAAAAAVLVVVVMRPWRPEATRRQADSAFAAGPRLTLPEGSTTEMRGGAVQFDLRLPTDAREVVIVGDFNGWDETATPMVQQAQDGTWSAQVPLSPGRHVYAFVVDGRQWLVDPLAPQVPDAGFGPTNAVIVDGTPGRMP